MNKVDQMWEMLNDIQIPDGKLCIPITGGLDSRVLAGIVRQYREIDYSYFYFSEATENSVPYVVALMNRCKVKKYDLIKLDNSYRSDDAKQEIVEKFPRLQDYIYGCNHHGDILTGMAKSYKRERNYFLHEYEKENQYQVDITENKFKEIWKPWVNPRTVGFLMSYHRKDRIFQRTYIKMINKYLPDLASIPRCFETKGNPVNIDRGIVYYILKRTWDKAVVKQPLGSKK